MKLSPYAKTVVAFVVGLVTFVIGLLQNGSWNGQDTIALLGWIMSTLGVYQIPNKVNHA